MCYPFMTGVWAKGWKGWVWGGVHYLLFSVPASWAHDLRRRMLFLLNAHSPSRAAPGPGAGPSLYTLSTSGLIPAHSPS